VFPFFFFYGRPHFLAMIHQFHLKGPHLQSSPPPPPFISPYNSLCLPKRSLYGIDGRGVFSLSDTLFLPILLDQPLFVYLSVSEGSLPGYAAFVWGLVVLCGGRLLQSPVSFPICPPLLQFFLMGHPQPFFFSVSLTPSFVLASPSIPPLLFRVHLSIVPAIL